MKCSITVPASTPTSVPGTARTRTVTQPNIGTLINSKHTIGMPHQIASRAKRCENVYLR